MYIQIDRNCPTPIQRQISEQIRAHLAAGKLKEGDPLPGSRALADRIGVNPNTALRVYEQLAAEGLIELRPRAGAIVRKPPDDSPLETFCAELSAEIRRLIRRSLAYGLPPERFLDIFDEALASSIPEPPTMEE